jgi:antitoxin YefM
VPHQLKEQGHSRDLHQSFLAEVKNRLSECVSEVEQTHDRMTISRHGQTAAVPTSRDDLAEEAVDILAQPGTSESIIKGPS